MLRIKPWRFELDLGEAPPIILHSESNSSLPRCGSGLRVSRDFRLGNAKSLPLGETNSVFNAFYK